MPLLSSGVSSGTRSPALFSSFEAQLLVVQGHPAPLQSGLWLGWALLPRVVGLECWDQPVPVERWVGGGAARGAWRPCGP